MNREPLREVTDKDVETFWEDGVICLRGMIDRDWIERMRDAMERVLEKPGPQGLNFNADGTDGRMFYENHMWTYDDDFHAFVFESPLAQIAAALMRSNKINIVYDFILTKEPQSPYPTDWHQDEEFNPLEGTQCGGNWLPLDEVTLESGAVEYIKGSHKWGMFSHLEYEQAEKAFFHGYDQEPPDPNRPPDNCDPLPDFESERAKHDIVHFDTAPGDVVANHLRSIHYAPGNFTDRRRRAIGHRWAGDDATYVRRAQVARILPPCDPSSEPAIRSPPGLTTSIPRSGPIRRSPAGQRRRSDGSNVELV